MRCSDSKMMTEITLSWWNFILMLVGCCAKSRSWCGECSADAKAIFFLQSVFISVLEELQNQTSKKHHFYFCQTCKMSEQT